MPFVKIKLANKAYIKLFCIWTYKIISMIQIEMCCVKWSNVYFSFDTVLNHGYTYMYMCMGICACVCVFVCTVSGERFAGLKFHGFKSTEKVFM